MKSIEEKFIEDLDEYLDDKRKINTEKSPEYQELLELGMILSEKDYSQDSNQEKVYNQVLKNKNKCEGYNIMKKLNNFKRPVIVGALICIMGISFAQSSYADDLIEKVKNTMSTGHSTVIQYEDSNKGVQPVPEEFKGQFFDEDGNPVDVFSEEYEGKYYTAKGEEIAYYDDKIVTVAEDKKIQAETELVVKDAEKLNDYTCFNVIEPKYLPEGYKFDRAEFYKDEDGNVKDTKYITLYYSNGEKDEYIWMQQRYADEETACTMGTSDKIEEIQINGVKAILSADKNLDWELNGVLYMLCGRGEVTKDELIKIAESIK